MSEPAPERKVIWRRQARGMDALAALRELIDYVTANLPGSGDEGAVYRARCVYLRERGRQDLGPLGEEKDT